MHKMNFQKEKNIFSLNKLIIISKSRALFLVTLFLILTNQIVAQNNVIFNYTGTTQTFTVPCGVTSIQVKAWGAGGSGGGTDTYSGAIGGGGAYVTTTLAVTPGQVLTIIVGGGALGGGNCLANSPGGAGGWGNGIIGGARGGNSGSQGCSGGGGGGGAGSGVFLGTTPLVVAGGGGGGSGGGNTSSGAAGGGGGQSGFSVSGCTPGVTGGNSNGNGTAGGDRGNADGAGGGGGGGGYVGGTGGSPPPGCDCGGCGGGGGSSFSTGTGTTVLNGSGSTPGNSADPLLPSGVAIGGISSVQGGNGYLVITYFGGEVSAQFSTANICLGSDLVVTNTSSYQGSPITIYNWNFDDGSAIATDSLPNYVYTTAGAYNVSLVVSNGYGCNDTLIQSVTVHPQPQANFTVTEKCVDVAVPFVGTSSVYSNQTTYQWIYNSNVVSANSNYTNTFTTAGNNSITLIVNDVYATITCSDTISKPFFVHDVPVVQFTGDTTLCSGENILFTNGSTIQTTETLSYSWAVNGVPVAANTNFQNVSNQAGLYQFSLTATTPFGCTNATNANLYVYPIPLAPVLAATIPNCIGDDITLSASAEPASTIVWSGPLNFNSTNFTNTFPFYVNQIGNYSAFVTSQYGCISSISNINTTITNVYSFGDFEFPNIITPNNDQVNDELNLIDYFQTCDDYTISIFNRWGNLVFEENQDATISFDGTAQSGENLPEGVYYYKLVFFSGGDQKQGTKSGFIHIVR